MVKLLQKINGKKTVYGMALMLFAENMAGVLDGDTSVTILKVIYVIGMTLAGVGVSHGVVKDKKKIV